MASYTIPPLLHAILHEADVKWPGRSHASDGTIGDASHQATVNDHNPDPVTRIVHAADVTNDPAHGFDAWAEANKIRARCMAGTERRVKYLNSFDGTHDVWCSPNSGWSWVRNGNSVDAHRSHLHISIWHETWVEQSTAPIFVGATEPPAPETPTTPVPKDDDMPKPTDIVATLDNANGRWQLESQGGVKTKRGKFYGSYFTLDPKDRNDPDRRFVAISGRANNAPGYIITSSTGEDYEFTKAQ